MRLRLLLNEVLDSKPLQEDVEERKMFREQARQVWNDFIKYIKSGGEFRARFISEEYAFDYEPKNFVLFIEIADVSPYIDDDRFTIALSTSDIRGEGRYNNQNHTLYIDVFPVSTIKEIYENKLEVVSRVGQQVDYKELAELIAEELKRNVLNYIGDVEKEVFMHEYTHYIDFNYKKAVMSYDRENVFDNLAEYFNDPVETNARFQAALASFEDDYNKEDIKTQFQDFEDFQSLFFENYGSILGLDGLMQTDKDVLKSFKKRLYKYWDKIL